MDRALYARRLWQSAEVFESSGRKEPAQLARGTARALAAGKASSTFVNRFFARVIELSNAAQVEQAEKAAHAAQGPAGAMPAPPGAGRLIVP